MNALLGWAVVGATTLGAATSVVADRPVWGVLATVLVAVAVAPAVAAREWTALVPWPLLAVAATAVTLGGVGVAAETAGVVTIATLALVATVELDCYTPVDLSRRFAVGFAVATAMALEAIWIVVQFVSDRWLGTAFLTTQTELQRDIVVVAVASLAIGGSFYWYFARFEPAGLRPTSSAREQAP